MNQTGQLFNKNKALLIKDVVSPELAKFFTHALMRCSEYKNFATSPDPQVPNALRVDHEPFFETLLERVWPLLEVIVDEELLPTYAYARLYRNGDVLEPHIDRPACEVSMTIQLGRSHHYAWPIHMGDYRYDLAEGDGVVYKGCEVEHWREECRGPKDYYSGQVFIHFVRKNGPFASEFCDSTARDAGRGFFVKHRAHLMESK